MTTISCIHTNENNIYVINHLQKLHINTNIAHNYEQPLCKHIFLELTEKSRSWN